MNALKVDPNQKTRNRIENFMTRPEIFWNRDSPNQVIKKRCYS